MAGIIFSIFVCILFHILFAPPMWATAGLFTIMFVQYSIAAVLADGIKELANAK